MLRAFVFALVAILVIQAYAAVIPNMIPVSQSLNEQQPVDSSSMLEVRGLGDRLRKFKGKFRQKLNPTSKSKDSDSIRAADTPSRSKASLNEGNETAIPSGAANSTTPRKHRGGQRKMGPQPAFEEEDQSKGKEPALPNSSIVNDTSQITEGSNTTSQTSSSTKHHHHHHRHHHTSNATANIHVDDDDDTSTLKPPTRHRGSTVTANAPLKPDLKRVNSSMSSGSDYAVTISSEDGNNTRPERPERLRVPGHHRTSSSTSGRHRDSFETVMRTGSSASRGPGGPNRGRPRSGSMNKSNYTMDRSSTREKEREREKEKEKEREREREREREKAENRASALYATTQNTQNIQTAQTAATMANTFATNYGNAAAPVPGMTKPPGTR
ncbi:hypothetical protein EV368DRAFT_81708 [Lentinula lateritia]|nr:hypothetical protein EV368DRAFT_81708 [Lentinula lateritia]